VPADRLVVGFAAPGLADDDRAAYEVLAELLTGGPSSRLYRRLVLDAEIASSVNGDVPPTQQPGLFAVWVQMTKGHAAAEAEAIIEAEVARFAARAVTSAELEKAKAQMETSFWQPISASEGKAEQLGLYAVAAGSHRRLLDRAREYAHVSPDDLRRVAASYWRPGARSVVVARPK
jgi:predicted Zn-dependent peptidase